eukprot:GHVQ01013423.1.p1 GENE.GHVQ01013423.1~~GHVQ01013423.1.p1  ORF type:complete len:675 (+),score=63.56 GHVQ01013423.1:98-2122(+)
MDRWQAGPALEAPAVGSEGWACETVSTADYQRLTETSKSLKFSTKIVANACCCSFLFGYNIAVMNSCSSIIATYFRWCSNSYSSDCRTSTIYQSAVNSTVFLGAMIGAFFAKDVLRRGRRFGLMLANVLFAVGGIIGMSAIGVGMLLASRVMSGVGLGMVTVITPMYISEMVPVNERGYYVTMHQIFISLGILISIALGLPQTQNVENSPSYKMDEVTRIWWRFLLGFSIIPALTALVGFAWVCTQETPTVDMHDDRLEAAVSTIMRIYDTDKMEQVEEHLVELKMAVEEGRNLRHIKMIEALGEPYYRFGLLVGMALAVLQQLCGINVIISASNDLFANVGMTSGMVTSASTAVAISNVLVTLLIAPFVESWGRRRLLLVGVFCQGLSMLPICLARLFFPTNTWVTGLSLICTVLFVSFFAIALGPVVWVYLSEIYPVEIRGTALAYCGLINWASCVLLVFSSKFLSTDTAFNIFAAVCFIGWLFCYRFIIETSGTSLENSPVSPRSLRSDSSLIRRSREKSPSLCVEDIRTKLRHAASFPTFHGICPSPLLDDEDLGLYQPYSSSIGELAVVELDKPTLLSTTASSSAGHTPPPIVPQDFRYPASLQEGRPHRGRGGRVASEQRRSPSRGRPRRERRKRGSNHQGDVHGDDAVIDFNRHVKSAHTRNSPSAT